MSPQAKIKIDDWTKWITRAFIIGSCTIGTNAFLKVQADVDILLRQQTGWIEWRIAHERRADIGEASLKEIITRVNNLDCCE